MPHSPADWEAFYQSYRKPGYIPGFEILNKLGTGIFGIVFKARKESIGKDYAVKFLKVDDDTIRDTVLRELEGVRFFAQLDHPNLVSIEDQGEVDGIPYILMNYAGDETLRTRLEGGALDREAGLQIFIQAARGVLALHEHSIVHFDLKPANIFLKGEVARVGDYGLSKLVAQSHNSLSFGRGTPYYMAPEILKRRGDLRSDIYSLGVILFECLTGDVPFRGDSEWEILHKHETEQPQFPSVLDEGARRVIARCMQKDPEHRFESVADLLRGLEEPASSPPPPAPQPKEETPEPAVPDSDEVHDRGSGYQPATAPAPSDEGSPGSAYEPPPAIGPIQLTDAQRAAVIADPGYLRIVAGPGSGKTRALTERIRHFVEVGWAQPWHVLAVTFTVNATQEMRLRLRVLLGDQAQRIAIKTLHALALSIARSDPAKAGLPETFDVGMAAGRREVLLDKALDALRREPDFPPELLEPDRARRAIGQIKHTEPYRLIDGDGSPEVRLCETFDALVRKDRVALFDDLGVAALRLLRVDPEAREKFHGRFRAIFVDEFQDLDATQFHLIQELSAGHGVLSVVGDDDQCIYTWRGANPSYLRDFDRHFDGAQTLLLVENHRSTRTIVDAARAVIDHNEVRIDKDLVAATTEQGSLIEVRRFGGIQAEVSQVVEDVCALLQGGVPPNTVAVLARNNDLVQAVVMEARAEGLPVHADNPMHTSSGVNLFNLLRTVLEGPGDPFFQGCVNLGRRRVRKSQFRELAQGAAVQPEDVEPLLRAMVEAPGPDVPSAQPLREFFAVLDTARAEIQTDQPFDVLQRLVAGLDLPQVETGDPKQDELHAATALVLEVARRLGSASGPEAWADLLSDVEELRLGNEGLSEAVNVLTVHRSKGLEFDHVFILGVQGDKFPNLKFTEQDPVAMEEARRLFYVGVTRARKVLRVSNHALYSAGDRTGPDRDGFIQEIPQALTTQGDE